MCVFSFDILLASVFRRITTVVLPFFEQVVLGCFFVLGFEVFAGCVII
jgi:hypothetical protein